MRIEKGGKPTVLLSAPAFKEEAFAQAKIEGIPYLPVVVIDYDQSYFALIPQQTEKVFDKMVKALTTPTSELEKKIPGEVT